MAELPRQPPDEARFFELSEDLHALLDLDGSLRSVNPAWSRVLGWPPDELLGRPLAARVHGDDVDAVRAELARAREAPVRFSCRFATSAGGWRRLEWVVRTRVEDGLTCASAREVTEPHRAEAATAESELSRQIRSDDLWQATRVLMTDAALVCTYHGGGGSPPPVEFVGMPLLDVYAPYGRRGRELVGYHEQALGGPLDQAHDPLPVSGENLDMSIIPLRGAGGIAGTVAVAATVTEQLAQDTEAERMGRRFRQMIEHSPIGMALVGLSGRWLQVNPALCEMLGYPEELLLGRTFQDLTHPDDLETDLALLDELVAGDRQSYEMEKRYFRADGSMVWALLTVSLLRGEDGEPVHFLSQVLDITDRKAEQSRLRVEADADALTGALNRRRFEEVLTTAIASARGRRDTSALLFLDLDGFKAINDAHGHQVGDVLLTAIAAAIAARLRVSDHVGRHGGDEFVVLLDRVTEAQAQSLAEELGEVVRGVAVPAGDGAVRVGASVGMALLDGVGLPTAQEALQAADRDMYRVKRSPTSG